MNLTYKNTKLFINLLKKYLELLNDNCSYFLYFLFDMKFCIIGFIRLISDEFGFELN
jgi:hypothetical protein